MGPTETLWLVGGIVGLIVLFAIGFAIVYRLRGPVDGKVVDTRVVGLGERFDWTVHAAQDGRHILWIKLGVEFEGEDASDVAFRLRMQIDDAPERAYLFNCDGDPSDGGMQGRWMARMSVAASQGTYACTVWTCGFRPRPKGTPIRMRGVILGEPSVKSGGFELRFARK